MENDKTKEIKIENDKTKEIKIENDKTKEINADNFKFTDKYIEANENNEPMQNDLELDILKKDAKSVENPKKVCKALISENSKIRKIIKKIIKHINYLEKDIINFKKFSSKNIRILNNFNSILTNFNETLVNLKEERDFLEQKHLNNKIFIDKLKDVLKK